MIEREKEREKRRKERKGKKERQRIVEWKREREREIEREKEIEKEREIERDREIERKESKVKLSFFFSVTDCLFCWFRHVRISLSISNFARLFLEQLGTF